MIMMQIVVCLVALQLAPRVPDDPFVGTWKLNLAKTSMLNLVPDNLPKSRTVKYELTEKSAFKIANEQVSADGSVFKSEGVVSEADEQAPRAPTPPPATATQDGLIAALTAASTSTSFKRIGRDVLEVSIQKKARPPFESLSAVVSTSRRVVSRDGNTMIYTDTIFADDRGIEFGSPIVLMWVFDKQ